MFYTLILCLEIKLDEMNTLNKLSNVPILLKLLVEQYVGFTLKVKMLNYESSETNSAVGILEEIL